MELLAGVPHLRKGDENAHNTFIIKALVSFKLYKSLVNTFISLGYL